MEKKMETLGPAEGICTWGYRGNIEDNGKMEAKYMQLPQLKFKL